MTISTIKEPCEQECNDTYSAIVLKYIYIEPKYRRCGLGSAIIKDIIFAANKLSAFAGMRFIMLEALKEKN